MYCDLWPYVLWPLDFQIQKRIVSVETIWGNTVDGKICNDNFITGPYWNGKCFHFFTMMISATTLFFCKIDQNQDSLPVWDRKRNLQISPKIDPFSPKIYPFGTSGSLLVMKRSWPTFFSFKKKEMTRIRIVFWRTLLMISFPKVHQLLDLIYEVLIIQSQVT